mmetsp:Transcript_43157/g.93713  ORF Transcript_43157/g.93713 Transcript_43157/m.93713 type:complete len:243 (+) Transcript_43157:518-1246(+)
MRRRLHPRSPHLSGPPPCAHQPFKEHCTCSCRGHPGAPPPPHASRRRRSRIERQSQVGHCNRGAEGPSQERSHRGRAVPPLPTALGHHIFPALRLHPLAILLRNHRDHTQAAPHLRRRHRRYACGRHSPRLRHHFRHFHCQPLPRGAHGAVAVQVEQKQLPQDDRDGRVLHHHLRIPPLHHRKGQRRVQLQQRRAAPRHTQPHGASRHLPRDRPAHLPCLRAANQTCMGPAQEDRHLPRQAT